MIDRLKDRWGITGNFQLVMVLLVFALTGSATLVARTYIFDFLGIAGDTQLWVKVLAYIAVVFPVYQALFLLIGGFLGQFRFAWAFEKKMLSRIPAFFYVLLKR